MEVSLFQLFLSCIIRIRSRFHSSVFLLLAYYHVVMMHLYFNLQVIQFQQTYELFNADKASLVVAEITASEALGK